MRNDPSLARWLLLTTLVLLTSPVWSDSYDDIILAVKLGNNRTISALMQRGMPVNSSDNQGNTLLILAVREQHPQTVDLLIKAGANVNLRNRNGDSALGWATLREDTTTAKKLLKAGAKLNHDGWTPIMYAAYKSLPSMMDLYLHAGADPNLATENGITALMLATLQDCINCVKSLLSNSVLIDEQNSSGETALDIARKKGFQDIYKLLVNAAPEFAAHNEAKAKANKGKGAVGKAMVKKPATSIIYLPSLKLDRGLLNLNRLP